MRFFPRLALALLAASCAEPKRPPAASAAAVEPPLPSSTAPALVPVPAPVPPPSRAACIVVAPEAAGVAATIEGELTLARSVDGPTSTPPLVVRLVPPRCVVGLARSSFLTEVYVASTGPDLRPLVDRLVRIHGDVIAGTNDLGGPAVVILAKDVERIVPPAKDDALR